MMKKDCLMPWKEKKPCARSPLKKPEVILMQNNAPVARLTRVEWEPPHPQFGSAKEVIVWMADDFPAPLEDFAEYM